MLTLDYKQILDRNKNMPGFVCAHGPSLKKHIEIQFKEGMSWENHSLNGWHIDHIIPCASFDLTDPDQQKKCFHYTNLQPLEKIENIKKLASERNIKAFSGDRPIKDYF